MCQTLFPDIALRQLVKQRTGCIVDEGMLHAERIEKVGFQEVGEGLTGDNRHDQRQQHIARAAVGVLRADREVWSRCVHDPFEHSLVAEVALTPRIFRQTRRVVKQVAKVISAPHEGNVGK